MSDRSIIKNDELKLLDRKYEMTNNHESWQYGG